MKTRNIFIAGLLSFFLVNWAAGAQSVDMSELVNNQNSINFVNYQGPYARIDSRATITNLGGSLGANILNGDEGSGDLTRYFVIHSVTDGEDGKLNADVFGLGRNVGVDHINALRMILQGYLQAAYAYSDSDASLLAQYITVYNAVFRQNMDYFTGKYKSPVLKNLSPESAGLSVRYSEWPARTLMVIPLSTGKAGELSALNTSVISSSEVVEQMRQAPDMGVPARQEMVDLKERESGELAARSETAAQAAAQEERRIEADRGRIAEERDNLENVKITGTPEEVAAAEERGAELDKEETELGEREVAVEGQKEEAAELALASEQKLDEAQAEREQIAQDQTALINGRAPIQTEPPTLFAIVLGGASNDFSTPVKIDAATKQVRQRSTGLNSVHARTVVVAGGGRVFAVAGENRADAAVRLVEIDTGNLGMKKQGADDIKADSYLWLNGVDLYSITSVNGALFLGRYNQELERQALSTRAVHPFAGVFFQGGQLFTQAADGSVMVLNPQTLAE
jgi:hypothetical protein